MCGLHPTQRGRMYLDSGPAHPIEWSAAWGVVAGTVTLFFMFIIGPGLR